MQMPYLHSITARHASISARPANHGIFPASSRFFSQPFPKRCRFRPWCRDFSYFTRNNFHLTSSWTGRNWSKQKLSEKKPIRILRKWNWNLALNDSSNDQTWRRRRNTIDMYRIGRKELFKYLTMGRTDVRIDSKRPCDEHHVNNNFPCSIVGRRSF